MSNSEGNDVPRQGMRIGIGYDVHPLVEGRKLVLGGVLIPSERGLGGHSDADVLLHSIMDALLGSAGLRDIGFYFPAGDARFKDISSLELLSRVGDIIRKKGKTISNIDTTIVAEQPRLSPYFDEMKHRISQTLGIRGEQVGIKATTSEGLGFAGRSEGIAAYAVVLLEDSSR
ncbi:MAG: IspF [Dehalococcoidia bacterium]|nr:IspF [Dehalococcoidia bacterium]